MFKHVRKIADWGIEANTPVSQAQHYRLTNVLLLFLLIASVAQTLMLFITGARDAAILNSTAPFVFGIGLWLMKKGQTILARLLVICISYSASYAIAASLGPESNFQFILLFASAFSVAFFSIHEKWLLGFALVIPLFVFGLLELNGYQPVWGMTRAQLSHGQLLGMRVASTILVWILMVFHFAYFIRDRRRSQQQLVSSTKMVALARMAAGIAHEVNNPLQLIFIYAEQLKVAARAPNLAADPIVELSDKILSVAKRIGTVNKGLLALSHDSKGEPFMEVPIQSVVRLALDFCRAHIESQSIELRLGRIPDQWTVVGRETQLSEVVLNILNNAYDALAKEENKWILIEASADNRWVYLTISDNGPGVPVEVQSKIFDPFFTTKQIGKGTGLGLSVSQGIMADHKGEITYNSEHAGAQFIIRIPRGRDKVVFSLARTTN